MRAARLSSVLILLVVGLSACDREGAYGDANSIIAVTSPEFWPEIENDVYEALETRIRTVRDEKMFTVTYQNPADSSWLNLKRFKQMLIIGPESDPIVAEVLAESRESNFSPPQLIQVHNVWARGQQVTVLLTPETDMASAVRNRLPELHALYDGQYREWAYNRMFISGADSTLADSLYLAEGFSLMVPTVYELIPADSVFIFRNDNPDPAELIRQIAVTWRTPIPEGIGGEELLEWRREVAAAHYTEPQLENLDNVEAGPFESNRLQAYQIKAVWENTPEADWPAAGPFILWGLVCPGQDRMYMIDAWLYAPGKEKYEFMIQLETILESFRCAAD